MQDMLAQIAVDEIVLSPVQSPASFEYSFEERARIAQVCFDPSGSAKPDGYLDRQISIVGDLISLCARQERRSRRPRQSWDDKAAINLSENVTSDVDMNPECSDIEATIGDHFSLQCQPFQCLHCLDDATLSLCERRHVFGSKHSLQRHFDRHHQFQSGQNCPFPNNECTQLTLESLMHFKNHAAGVHGIYMSQKC